MRPFRIGYFLALAAALSLPQAVLAQRAEPAFSDGGPNAAAYGKAEG